MINKEKRVSTGTRLKQLMSERGLKQVDILKASEPYQKKLNVQLKKIPFDCINFRNFPRLSVTSILTQNTISSFL